MIVRMATLSSGGRIDLETVREELARSRKTRPLETQPGLADLLGPDYAERFDYFELAQLQEVVKVCQSSRSLADAGKKSSFPLTSFPEPVPDRGGTSSCFGVAKRLNYVRAGLDFSRNRC